MSLISSGSKTGTRTLLWLVLAVEDRKLSEDTHVGTLKRQSSLQQREDLIEEAFTLIGGNNAGELLSVNDDIETTNLSLDIQSVVY